MNGEISKDCFGVTLSFLDIYSIKQLRKTNKLNKEYVNQFPHIVLEKELIKVWGSDLINLLKNYEKNFKRDIKVIYNKYINNTKNVRLAFYVIFLESICNNKNFILPHGLFMSIYDICYFGCASNNVSYQIKNYLLNIRRKYIKKYFIKEEINEQNKTLIKILNVTRQIDKNNEEYEEYNRKFVIEEISTYYD